MWDSFKDASDTLLGLHLKLTNHLNHLSWQRTQLWNNRASVHEWSYFQGLTLAFDVVPDDNKTTITLIVRQGAWVDSVRQALIKSPLPTPPLNEARPERMRLAALEGANADNLDALSKTIAQQIAKARTIIEDLVRPTFNWTDEQSDISLRYTVKQERKQCREVIFIFSSIRSNHDWLDFRGPAGPSVQPNRARLVFMEDVFTKEFTYHLAINGDTSVREATIRFIRSYVQDNNYNWENVTLAGMSKGGTTAIIIGANLPSCTVVALAPQLRLGDYLQPNRPRILANITGQEPDDTAHARVDQLMWSSVPNQQGAVGIRACYVLTSENDPDCTNGLQDLVACFGQPDRVMISVDRSGQPKNHLETVHFLSPVFLSLLTLVSAGLRPLGWLNDVTNSGQIVRQ